MAFLTPKREALAWDILFLLFVFFPLVTGGLWLHRPHLHLELAQPGPAAVVLGAWLLLARRKGNSFPAQSFVILTMEKCWEFWCRQLRSRETLTLIVAWIFFGSLWFSAAWARHITFRSGSIDLGIFTNAIWNLSQTGIPFAALKSGHSLLTDHQSFTIFPLSRIFALYPGPGILLFLQAYGLSAGGIALYLLGKQRAMKVSELLPLLPFLYWAYPPNRAANLFDFHPEVFMLPFFLFGIWGLQEKSWTARALGLLCFAGGMASKESGGPVAVGIGLAWLAGSAPEETRKFTRIFSLAAIAGGVALFLFDTKVLPQSLGMPYGYGDVFAPFGSSLSALAMAPFLYPTEFFSRLFGWSRLNFLYKLLLPLGFLPLLAPISLLAALPGFCMLFLSLGDQRLSLGFHYAIEPSVGIFLALVAAMASVRSVTLEHRILLVLPWILLFTYGRSEPFQWRRFPLTPHQTWVKNEILPKIDPAATLAATNALVPHLATRHWSHYIPILTTEEQKLVDCVLWERTLNNSPMSGADENNLNAELKEKYFLEYSCGSFTLHRLKERSLSCASALPACPAESEKLF
ncbi:MAG: DUF2079 domain-containing protein [Bdellovibrionota bacterium]